MMKMQKEKMEQNVEDPRTNKSFPAGNAAGEQEGSSKIPPPTSLSLYIYISISMYIYLSLYTVIFLLSLTHSLIRERERERESVMLI